MRRSEVFAFAIESRRGAAGSGHRGDDAFLRWAQAMCRRGEAVYDPTFVERMYGNR